MISTSVFLKSIHACQDAINWAEDRPILDCWNECTRPDWLLFLINMMHDKPGWPTRRQVILTQCLVAEYADKFLLEERNEKALNSIRAAKSWLNAEAMEEPITSVNYVGFIAYTVINPTVCDLIRTTVSIPATITEQAFNYRYLIEKIRRIL